MAAAGGHKAVNQLIKHFKYINQSINQSINPGCL